MYFQGQEVFFDKHDLIVSKTDLQGRLTYTNRMFLDIAGYSEAEVIGQQHNVIRNSNMPRVIFELLWSTIKTGEEIFAFVVNSTKTGDHYWVIAHVTPSLKNGAIVGYHSTRRVPSPTTIRNVIIPLYDKLKSIEEDSTDRKTGLRNSIAALSDILKEKGVSYDEFISSLIKDD